MTHLTPAPTPRQDDTTEDRRVEDAHLYVRQLKVFYVHASVFAGSMIVNFLVNLAVSLSAGIADEWRAWWSLWALIGWGAGITVHGLVVRLNRPSLSSATWEQREVDKLLAE